MTTAIELLPITEFDESHPHDPKYLVFQVLAGPCEDVDYDLSFPMPERGRDAECDWEDLRSMPIVMFHALLGRLEPYEWAIGKFFRMRLPEGVFNG